MERIVSITQATRLTPDGRLVPTMVVSYMVDEFGPFSVEIDKVEFTAEKARELVAKEAEQIRKTLQI